MAAPMPGLISTLNIKKGQQVKTGDVLLTIEAMKMETALHSPRDGKVAEILINRVSPIDAKDLLIVLEYSVGESNPVASSVAAPHTCMHCNNFRAAL